MLLKRIDSILTNSYCQKIVGKAIWTRINFKWIVLLICNHDGRPDMKSYIDNIWCNGRDIAIHPGKTKLI